MEKSTIHKIKACAKNQTIQKYAVVLFTLFVSFCIVFSGAMPKKYKVNLGDVSEYDITAPREIQNSVKTKENRELAYKKELPDMKEDTATSIEVIRKIDEFLTIIKNERNLSKPNLERVLGKLKRSNVSIIDKEYVNFLLCEIKNSQFNDFEHHLKLLIADTMKEDITNENLKEFVLKAQMQIQKFNISTGLKNIGSMVVENVLRPNRIINEEATQKKRESAYNDPKNIEIIEKGQRILSVGDIVTKDKLYVLEDLNMLETKDKVDYRLMIGIFTMLSFLTLILVVYVKTYCENVLEKLSEIIMVSFIIITELIIARLVGSYEVFLIPVFFAGIVISILSDLGLALLVNLVLAVSISFIDKGNLEYMYMMIVSGSLVCFFSKKANQRNRLTAVGIYASIINVFVVLSISMINRVSFSDCIVDCIYAFLNGIISIILTIGMLPFLETVFNIITPMRLLELSNPDQPLLKRLLLEAPGTYHHSLMVGNLAEEATHAIGGNPLLARVGAYYHDIGKLKRPNFFMENQSSENPHDKMLPNLSALVITSHTEDGAKLAKKYKLPVPIINLIVEHHGTTKLVYFYHKAKKMEKEEVKEENFRYKGPKPSTKEAAVVMLADSVEAAVRSMTDKTEGKIEGYIRKIIKDKLNDGQFDLCNLTLKDMNNIAKAFMRVLSGYFHEREEYPKQDSDKILPKYMVENIEGEGVFNENLN